MYIPQNHTNKENDQVSEEYSFVVCKSNQHLKSPSSGFEVNNPLE